VSDGFAAVQRALPHHAISRAIGHLAKSTTPWIKNTFIQQFANAYKVNMDEAAIEDLTAYASFNDFFTRALKASARPIDADPSVLVSPADGAVSQLGPINEGQLLQAKGHKYSIQHLAGGLSPGFNNGTFITIYLAPSDYHRVHLPWEGRLIESLAVPGALFSVNGSTERAIPGLFCRNERLVCRFETDFGPMLVILVGAMIVASIETVWPGAASPYHKEVHASHDVRIERGAEMGRFLLGSTVICCFPKTSVVLQENLTEGSTVRMGQAIAYRQSD
jgi:phosphatidylserine decarboxylase